MTDEQLIERLDELEGRIYHLGIDGKEGSPEWVQARGEAVGIYNALRAKGWRWDNENDEWVLRYPSDTIA